jgi:hypothetical protein
MARQGCWAYLEDCSLSLPSEQARVPEYGDALWQVGRWVVLERVAGSARVQHVATLLVSAVDRVHNDHVGGLSMWAWGRNLHQLVVGHGLSLCPFRDSCCSESPTSKHMRGTSPHTSLSRPIVFLTVV